MLNVLGRTYRFEIKAPLIFEHVPPNKALNIRDSRQVKLIVEAPGWNFIRSRLEFLNEPIHIDLGALNSENRIDLNTNLESLNAQMPTRTRVIGVEPRILEFSFEPKAFKKVPVKLNLETSFEAQHDTDGPTVLVPDSVTITGPVELIKRISDWPTKLIVLNNLYENVDQEVELLGNDHLNLQLSHTKVRLMMPVEKYTEGEVEVPIQARGFLNIGAVHLFPSVCTVKYQVSLHYYNKVKPQDFTVIAQPSPFGSGQLDVDIADSPSYIRYPRVYPQRLDYILQK